MYRTPAEIAADMPEPEAMPETERERRVRRERTAAKVILFVGAEAFIAMLSAAAAHDTRTSIGWVELWVHLGIVCMAAVVWALVKLSP